MKRKLIALAVATAFAAPAAMAEVTVYGKVHVSVENIATDVGTTGAVANGGTTIDDDKFTVNSNASRLGFKGSEDLGNGLSAIFKYEMTYDVDGDDGAGFTPISSARNAYLGLAGSFGTVLVGRHDTPAKMAYYAAGTDNLDGTVADLNDRVGFTENRVNNAIAYVSPKMSGLQLAAAIVPGEESGATGTATDADNGFMDSYSVGLMYGAGGLKAGLGYEEVAQSGGDTDVKTVQMGASYTMDAFTLGAHYGRNDNASNVLDAKATNMAVSGTYRMGDNAIMVNYGKNSFETSGSTTEVDTTATGLGFQHNMSNRTNVYVAYSNTDTDNGATVFICWKMV
jgi:predicted porin